MAITKPKWSTEQLGYDSTIAAAGTGGTNIDLATNGWDVVSGLIDADLGSASSLNVKIYRSTDGGTSYSDWSLAGSFSINASGVYPFDIYGESNVRVAVENEDGSNATNTVTVNYRGRTWETV